MQQTSLFDYTPPPKYPYAPPHRGIETSIEGAKKIAPKCNGLHQKIIMLLRDVGGMNNCELREAIGNIENGTMSARIRELVLQGKVRDSGVKRKGKSGVSQIVWVLA